jgi:hypothetical protein
MVEMTRVGLLVMLSDTSGGRPRKFWNSVLDYTKKHAIIKK